MTTSKAMRDRINNFQKITTRELSGADAWSEIWRRTLHRVRDRVHDRVLTPVWYNIHNRDE